MQNSLVKEAQRENPRGGYDYFLLNLTHFMASDSPAARRSLAHVVITYNMKEKMKFYEGILENLYTYRILISQLLHMYL